MKDQTPPDDGIGSGLSGTEAELTHEIDSDEQPSRAVVRAVASVTNTPVLDLDPLYEAIDPDHLDGICGETNRTERAVESSISFPYNGCRVTVQGDRVFVRVGDW